MLYFPQTYASPDLPHLWPARHIPAPIRPAPTPSANNEQPNAMPMPRFPMPPPPDRIRRYREVVEVLARHGFGALVHELRLDQGMDLPRRLFRRPPKAAEALTPAIRLRLVLEELGPTFIKLGQALSTRPDLLPPAYIEELSKLQDQAPPVPWDTIRASLESELGMPIDQAFTSFDPVPIGCASLGQVHAAVRLDGTPVVVKVLRPGVLREVERDIDVLFNLAGIIQPRAKDYLFVDLVEVTEEFATAIRAELNYQIEGRNADRYRENFAKQSYIVVPKVYWDQTTRRVLVMQRVSGIKIDDIDALKQSGANLHKIAENLTRFYIQSILADGFFHADPHPGNFLIQPGSRIAVLDYGRVGRLGWQDQLLLARLSADIVQLNARGTTDGLLALAAVEGKVDHAALERDMRRLLNKYEGLPLEDIRVGPVFQEALALAQRHHLRIPGQWALLIQTLAIAEGVGARLAPDLNVFTVARPYLLRLQLRRWSPKTLGLEAANIGGDWAHLGQILPRSAARLLEQVERGQLAIEVRPVDLDPILRRVDRIANRATVAAIMCALIVGIALIMPHVDFTWPGRPIQWMMIGGSFFVFGLAIWLVWRMWRGD